MKRKSTDTDWLDRGLDDAIDGIDRTLKTLDEMEERAKAIEEA